MRVCLGVTEDTFFVELDDPLVGKSAGDVVCDSVGYLVDQILGVVVGTRVGDGVGGRVLGTKAGKALVDLIGR